ncbi:MAG: universal stress protein [Persicimonas sp.]
MERSRIIVATDLSDQAAVAATWAHHFAREHDLEVVVAHVIKIGVVNWAKGAYNVLEDTRLMRKAEARVEQWYEEVTGDAPAAVGVEVGHVPVQLGKLVEKFRASMLVVAVSGKGRLKRILLGSNAKNLASDPPCPLILVDPDHTEFHDPPRLAVGVDFSENGRRAAQFGARIAHQLGSSLDLVHADRAPTIEALEDEDLPEEFVEDGRFEWVEREMSDLVDRLRAEMPEVDYHTHCIEEDPARGLIDFVEERDSDLLVLGRTGQSRFVATVIGSVLLKMLQAVPTTLAIIPADYAPE